jgi:hypothetical protein
LSRGMLAEAAPIQSGPLAAGAQHEEDRIHRVALGHPRVVAAQRVGFARAARSAPSPPRAYRGCASHHL